MAGVNIAGCDLGVGTDGSFSPSDFDKMYGCPTSVGPPQMQHFSDVDKFNVFRIPAPWQSFVGNNLEADPVQLDDTFMNQYDGILQSCLSLGASCIIDIHNYARWWGQIVNQGGPESVKLAQTWARLAERYASNEKVIFGIMNEPHDLDINNWAGVVQDAVTAIRNAGATSQTILLAGTSFASAGGFGDQSGPALSGVKNPDGSVDNLVYEVHQYFDSDTSGTHTECSVDNAGTFSALGDYLRGAGRKAFVGEIGGGDNQGCYDLIGASLDVINQYSDVYLGWTSWAAGNWWPEYELNELPNDDGSDKGIISQCFAAKFTPS
ncbi:hypothetical protein FH972_023684 [Carpinus fangiana]|uniref:Glycoside hydrolase family 5 domain-containing protein n=1 Tax=Carpinus fangiana TaxID=176857 RepID=A0A5N6KWA2_9ROSI|nr:hypothetical protein FH972_023684 [Carpinus fangiana]